MYFGVEMPLKSWLLVITAAVLALIIPFGVIGSIVAPLPEPMSMIVEFALAYFGFPALLCYLHSRKVFGRGIGSVFFKVYTWFYLLIGVAVMVAAFNAEGGFSLDNFIFAALMLAVGVGMLWWSRRTAAKFAAAVEEEAISQAALEREEDIERQAEAILRAEEMKRQQGGAE